MEGGPPTVAISAARNTRRSIRSTATASSASRSSGGGSLLTTPSSQSTARRSRRSRRPSSQPRFSSRASSISRRRCRRRRRSMPRRATRSGCSTPGPGRASDPRTPDTTRGAWPTGRTGGTRASFCRPATPICGHSTRGLGGPSPTSAPMAPSTPPKDCVGRSREVTIS